MNILYQTNDLHLEVKSEITFIIPLNHYHFLCEIVLRERVLLVAT